MKWEGVGGERKWVGGEGGERERKLLRKHRFIAYCKNNCIAVSICFNQSWIRNENNVLKLKNLNNDQFGKIIKFYCRHGDSLNRALKQSKIYNV